MLRFVTKILQATGLKEQVVRGKPKVVEAFAVAPVAATSSHPAFTARRVARIVMSPGDLHYIVEK